MESTTKYKEGDTFQHPTSGVWTLLKWEETSPESWRWRIEINLNGLKTTEAWTDDMWLDKLTIIET